MICSSFDLLVAVLAPMCPASDGAVQSLGSTEVFCVDWRADLASGTFDIDTEVTDLHSIPVLEYFVICTNNLRKPARNNTSFLLAWRTLGTPNRPPRFRNLRLDMLEQAVAARLMLALFDNREVRHWTCFRAERTVEWLVWNLSPL